MMNHLRLFENHNTKKYGFTHAIRDFKEKQREIMKYVKDIHKKYPDFFYEDMNTNWDDNIWTAITNYDNPQNLVDRIGEDIFLAEPYVADEDGIMWFDTVDELERMVADGMKMSDDEYDAETADYHALKSLGLRGKRTHDKIMKDLQKMEDFQETDGLPDRKGGWSLDSAATWLALKELGVEEAEKIEEAEIKKVKLSAEDDKKFRDDFTVDNKYMFDSKLSDDDRKQILMSKIDALAKKKRLNPAQTKKMKKQYSDNIKKLGSLDNVEREFRQRWSAVKYKKTSKEKIKGGLKSLLEPDPASVASFGFLDNMMADLLD